jgi:hypothetical protein
MLSPDSAIGRLRKVVLDLLHEHEQDGALPTNARFLYYELVARGVLEKHKPKGSAGRRSDQSLHEALTDLRQAGMIPWDWITDETRSLDDYTGWSSVANWATSNPRRKLRHYCCLAVFPCLSTRHTSELNIYEAPVTWALLITEAE